MSSPADHTDMLLAQDAANTTFQQPPARLNPEIEDSIIVKEEEQEEQEAHKPKPSAGETPAVRNGSDAQEGANDGSSASPIPLTQPILSDEDGADGGADSHVRNESKDSGAAAGGSSGLQNVQFKGQPVWQVDAEGLPLIRRMTDMRFYWTSLCELIEKTNTVDAEALRSSVTAKLSPDVNGDYWLLSEDVAALSQKYALAKYLEPLLSIPSNSQEPVREEAEEGQAKSSSSSASNDRKRANTESNVLESPSKKSKTTATATAAKDGLDVPIYTYDLAEGNPNFPFTLKPLSNDNVVNEHSKVIISSLFLPFQSKVTLAQVLESEAGFLNSSETGGEKSADTGVKHGAENGEAAAAAAVAGVKAEGKTAEGEPEIDDDANTENTKVNDDTLIDKNEINIDVPIDDNGQTALHLAATLGKVSLVQELIEKGANRFRGDNDGQTALIRVVHATNCFELGCFDKLLDLLYPSIRLLDNRGRSILHHIALTCGLKGRYDASKYYLETLLEWVVKKGSKLPDDSSLTLTNFIKEVVNKSDKYGNTCLNYATLAGNKYIVSQLLDICADPHKANKIGVTPGDWGIDVNNSLANSTVRDVGADITQAPNDSISRKSGNTATVSDGGADASKVKANGLLSNITAGLGDKPGKTQPHLDSNDFKESTNSLQILDSIQSFIANLGSDFKQEIVQKSQQIDKLNPILRDKTLQLSQKRKQYDELQKMVRKISKITNKIDNLNKAITEEENAFQQEIQNSCINIDQNNCLGDFDADQPFTILPLYQDVEKIVEKILEEKLKRIAEEKRKNGEDIDNDNDSPNKPDAAAGADADSPNVSSHAVLRALTSIKAEEILPYYEEQLPQEKRELLRKSIPPSVVLDARIRAYKKNNQILMDRMNKKRNSNKELESQFKRIIGLCIGTDTDNIDDRLLSSLLMSVETDPDPEIGQIKKVLKIVGDLDGDDGSPASHTAPASSTAS